MLECELRKQLGEKAAGRKREREMVKTAGLDPVDHLKELREEMAEMSLRVEKLGTGRVVGRQWIQQCFEWQ